MTGSQLNFGMLKVTVTTTTTGNKSTAVSLALVPSAVDLSSHSLAIRMNKKYIWILVLADSFSGTADLWFIYSVYIVWNKFWHRTTSIRRDPLVPRSSSSSNTRTTVVVDKVAVVVVVF